jgi:NitT/TauT family transport system ATP-binding protein
MQIDIEGLTKTFVTKDGHATCILDDFSLQVGSNEFLCILGPSGCGKTTLLNILAGLEQFEVGAVRFIGTKSARGPLTSMVFQDYALVPWRTVLSNVAFGLEVKHVPRRERHRVAMDLLRTIGLDEQARRFPRQLSGGMRQRVAIARALANDSDVLLMDEPFAAVDAQTRVLLQYELSRLLSERQKTVVFITHSIDEAIRLGDYVLVATPRPMRIIERVKVPFPTPRDESLEALPEYVSLRNRLRQALRDGIERATSAPAPEDGRGKGGIAADEEEPRAATA